MESISEGKMKFHNKKVCLFYFFVIFNLFFLSSCANNVEDLPLSKIVCNQNKENIIIFVHGLTGDLKNTWTNKETGAYWPEMICNDTDFDNFDVAVINYYSRIFNNDFTLKELGLWFNAELSNLGVLGNDKYKNIFFIAHSQGSLVVRSAMKLENYKYDTKKVLLLVSLASPSRGSFFATIGTKILPNNTSLSNLSSEHNYEVRNLNISWKELKGNTRVSCAYEKLDTIVSEKIVDEFSATSVCSGAITPFYANHYSISKPKNKNDRIYVWTKNEVLNAKKEIDDTKNNFVNMYSENSTTVKEYGKFINVKHMVELSKKLVYSDVPRFISSNIKNVENGISCEDFYEIYKRSLYQDALSIIVNSSKYIKRPISNECLQKIIDHVIFFDRERASTILINSN